MKKLMVVSKLVVIMLLAAISCVFAADVCVHLPDDLTLNMCLQYQNNYYTGTFRHSPVQNLPDGVAYWKLDAGTLKPATDTGYCFPVSNNLDMNICGEYQGTEYQFAFKYAPTGTDGDSILNWKIDLNSFRQRADANQDTVYNYAKDIARSFMEGNPNLWLERTSKAYLYDGTDYSCASDLLNYGMNTYTYPSYSYLINAVSYENQNGKQIAKINGTTIATQVSKSDPTKKTNSNSMSDITLIFEDGKWKFYGNQKPATGPSATGIVACESINTTVSPWKTVGVKTVFTSADTGVYVFVKFGGIHNGSVHYVKWYRPDGTLDLESNHGTINLGDYPKCAIYSGTISSYYKNSIKGYEAYWNQNAGVWRVEVYADNVKVGETTFEYKP